MYWLSIGTFFYQKLWSDRLAVLHFFIRYHTFFLMKMFWNLIIRSIVLSIHWSVESMFISVRGFILFYNPLYPLTISHIYKFQKQLFLLLIRYWFSIGTDISKIYSRFNSRYCTLLLSITPSSYWRYFESSYADLFRYWYIDRSNRSDFINS